MKRFEKILLGFLFSLLFFPFFILSSINFQLFNENYLFSLFERHNIYQKLPQTLAASLPNDPNLTPEEKNGYAQILKTVPPRVFEKTVKENVGRLLRFINGKTSSLEISIPAQELGLEGNNIQWSSQNLDAAGQNQFKVVNGFGNSLLVVWLIILTILVSIFFLYGRVSKPRNLLRGGKLLIINGVILFCLSGILQIFMFAVVKGMPSRGEPSQALIGLLFSSLLPEIVLMWLIAGAVVLALGILLERQNSKKK